MPFDLFVSHASSFDRVDRSGWLRRGQVPITPAAFLGAISGSASSQRADGDLWLRHPDDGLPWLAARLTPKGSVVLSCSYSNHRYLRNFPDAFELGLGLAEALGASLFEEVRGEKVTRSNVETLLSPDGRYVRLQVGTFESALERLHQDPGGPLEYPIGPIDLVGEYFVLHLTLPTSSPRNLAELLGAVELPRAPIVMEKSHAVIPTQSGAPATKVLLRPDQRVQIWPSHGEASFGDTATTTIATLHAFEAAFPGYVTFNLEPLTPAIRAELDRRSSGLGVEFYEWVVGSDASSGDAFYEGPAVK